jgi:hypothetical protein
MYKLISLFGFTAHITEDENKDQQGKGNVHRTQISTRYTQANTAGIQMTQKWIRN